jgi:hypothetical protein
MSILLCSRAVSPAPKSPIATIVTSDGLMPCDFSTAKMLLSLTDLGRL